MGERKRGPLSFEPSVVLEVVGGDGDEHLANHGVPEHALRDQRHHFAHINPTRLLSNSEVER